MSKPDKDHEDTRLTFSREHADHDGGSGTHVDGYRYRPGSDLRDFEKTHHSVTPGYGSTARSIPVHQADSPGWVDPAGGYMDGDVYVDPNGHRHDPKKRSGR